MNKRLLYSLLAGALTVVAIIAAGLPAASNAERQTIKVRLPNGKIVEIVRDVTKGTPAEDVLPGKDEPGGEPPDGGGDDPTEEPPDDGEPGSDDRDGDGDGDEDKDKPKPDDPDPIPTAPIVPQEPEPVPKRPPATDMRERDGSPAETNPTLTEAPGPSSLDELPAPGSTTAVPNFIINKFRVPIFLLPIYQAAGTHYGIRWEILAAINEIETDYGRNLNVSSAGAVGWMQFLPSTWRAYGTDANRDGQRDPYNPVDAIFAAARYLKAAGYEEDVRVAIFAYNHADWYVDSVMMRARLIAGIPSDLTGSLTGLTEGRFPVYAKASYADDISEREAELRIERGESAARVEEGSADRREIEIFARRGAPVIATADGEVKEIDDSRIVVQDAYGNQYTYDGLGSVSRVHPVARDESDPASGDLDRLPANDPAPREPASKGAQRNSDKGGGQGDAGEPAAPKVRLFANPNRPNARRAGAAAGLEDFGDDTSTAGLTRYRRFAAAGFGLRDRDARLEPLKKGSRVTGGTLLGRVGTPEEAKAPHMDFSIRPAGRGAPRIDPLPILNGWQLLESTAIYRANGRNVLREGTGVGQVLLMSKPQLERRVLADERIGIYPCGEQDIRTGQIDRRVLATLAYLSESGLRPDVTSLRCGHSIYTKSGSVSHHASGNAVDIARINGTPILGHQDNGGIAVHAVRRLMQLQGTMRPDQIISLRDFGANTISMSDHGDHIHVGFRPLFGSNRKLGKQALAVLKPGQWDDLLERLRSIEQPKVRRKPSKAALPAHKRASKAHRGE